MAIEYTSDSSVAVEDLRSLVKVVWSEYLAQRPLETRPLEIVLRRVHVGNECPEGLTELMSDVMGHAHWDAFCLDPDYMIRREWVNETVRHEMAHVTFTANHIDERWPEALRLMGLLEQADEWARQRAFFDGRIPHACPEGHGWEMLQPEPQDGAPFEYYCPNCEVSYDTAYEVEVTGDVVNQRRHAAVSLCDLVMSGTNPFHPSAFQHPTVRTLDLGSPPSSVEVRYSSTGGIWRATAAHPDGPTLGSGDNLYEAMASALKSFGDQREALLADLKGMDLLAEASNEQGEQPGRSG